MEKEAILELFRITDEKVAQIHSDTEAKIAAIRSQAEEEKRQTDIKISEIRSQSEEEIAAIRSQAAEIRKEAEEERRERDRALKRVSQHLDAYTSSVASVAEEYFYRCLKGNPYLGTFHFDEVLWDEKYEGKQYDVIMRNSAYVALVSVKTNLKAKAVTDLVNKDLPALKQYYAKLKGYEDVKFIGAVAGLTCKERALHKANERGVWVLTQSEDKQAKLVNGEITLRIF